MNITDYKAVYSTFATAMGNLGQHYWKGMRVAFEETGIEPPRGTFVLFTALALHPEPISSTYIQKRLPYGAEAPWAKLLSTFETEKGYLQSVKDDYRLTDEGHNAVRKIRQAFWNAITPLKVLSEADLATLVSLVKKIADAQAEASDPPGTEFIRSTANSRSMDAPLLARLDQLNDEMAAFRDECHIAAWRTLGVDGVTWDALSNVWTRQVSSAKELQDMLPFLGHSEAIFEVALQAATAKGWLSIDGEKYSVTEQGKTVRESAEDQADTYFFANLVGQSRIIGSWAGVGYQAVYQKDLIPEQSVNILGEERL